MDAPLRALSASLLQLTGLAQRAQPQTLLHDALLILRNLVPFDSAWWGEVSGGSSKAAPRNWMHGSIGLSKGFAQEWNQLSAADDFAQQSMRRLGRVFVENGPLQPGTVPPEIEAFCRKHGLFHCVAITVDLPDSGLMFFVSVYRRPSSAPFSAQESALFGEFVAHLRLHWSHAIDGLQQPHASRPWNSYALADQDGRLLFMGLRVGMALNEAFPQWSDTALPPDLVDSIRKKLPRTVAIGTASRLRLEPCGSLVALTIPSRQHNSPLAPRELGAAMLYAQGQSYKDIAATLGLAPATVRTYLRNVYALLGVRNKVELVAALRRK
ncbi:helix-turn-helix transcriptional regulator [Hydrogenophaga sp. OTU3427]|uniref:helix-turn-helix transcriptional regulator n=1 Tax=Hydrogenophaga sp. OTU3427 TaxID=3043856 RepID=UPI00313D1F23